MSSSDIKITFCINKFYLNFESCMRLVFQLGCFKVEPQFFIGVVHQNPAN